MPHKRLTIFLCVLLSLLILPTTLPYILGHIILPWWAFVFYAIIILVNAGIYLVQRCVLIDRFFVKRKIWMYILFSLVLLIVGLGLQYLTHAVFSQFEVEEGLTVYDFLGVGLNLAQLTLMAVLQLVTTFIALAVALSDEWRMAAFRYNEAEKTKRSLEKDVERLQGQVDAMKRPDAQKESISVKVDLMKRQLKLDDILYVRSDGDYIVFHLSDGEAPMVLMTLKALEKQLPFGRFCRIHRSYLVNTDKVDGLKGGKVLVAGEELPLSDSCKAAFFELISHKSISLHTNPDIKL
jgi:DNA-binding LytR/AlgR family response regulator